MTKTDIELLWETYEFVDKRLHRLEVEFADLLDQSKLYCMQNFLREVETGVVQLEDVAKADLDKLEVGAILESPVNRDGLRDQFTAVSSELDTYYGKQLTTVTDIKTYQVEHPFTTEGEGAREVDGALLEKLNSVPLELRTAHRHSSKKIFKMLDIQPPE